ncbi:MAG: tRNA pseudouridine(38-40) synthase TruA, partial [Bacteroidota bacterium]
MHYYQLKLQYDGSDYAGFQWQKDLSTIQQNLNRVLALCLRGKFTTAGASRTDSGVHALHQVMKLTCEEAIIENDLLKSLTQRLPRQIRILSLDPCAPLFHPSALATSKEYRYLFTN